MSAGADTWRAWAQRLRAIAQTGLAYSRDGYDLERFTEVQQIAEAMLAALLDVPPARLRDVYLPERGYPTPKVDVRAGVFREAGAGAVEVLLVQEASDGRWSLPGGWADEEDSPRQSIEREVAEESGFRVRAVPNVGLINLLMAAAIREISLAPTPDQLCRGGRRVWSVSLGSHSPAGASSPGRDRRR